MKYIVTTLVVVFALSFSFGQSRSENSSKINKLKTELKSSSNKETIKKKGQELKIREALEIAYKNNNQKMIEQKKKELIDFNKNQKRDYNTSRSVGRERKSTIKR